jgi:hypothetical protein
MSSRANRLPLLFAVYAGLCLIFAVCLGCEDQRRHATARAIDLPRLSPPVAADAAPQQVATAFLEALREAQETRASGLGTAEKRRRYDEAMSRLRALTAAGVVHKSVLAAHSVTLPKDLSEDAAVTLATESWVSLIAHYADAVLPDTLSVLPADLQNAQQCAATVEAERPDDAARIKQLTATAAVLGFEDSGGQHLAPYSSAYYEALRARTLQLEPPLNVPDRPRITLDMTRVDGCWRVHSVSLGPGRLSSPEPPPTTAPAASQPTFEQGTSAPAAPSVGLYVAMRRRLIEICQDRRVRR